MTMFRHEPLPNPTTYFRLLRIIQGGFDESIVCEVSNWRVEDAPAYIAVSYVWGDPKEVSTITINSRPATVRTNCEYVLQQQAAASATVGYYLWVDAICIDQQNTTERSHQVALMGRIYSKAARVHACTGPHADDSRGIFTDTSPTGSLLSRIARIHLARINPQLKFVLQTICFLAARRERREHILNAYIAFLSRPYFGRVWILQELYVGGVVLFFCGDGHLPATHLEGLRRLMAFWRHQHSDITSSEDCEIHNRFP